jgi:hypothetical protein
MRRLLCWLPCACHALISWADSTVQHVRSRQMMDCGDPIASNTSEEANVRQNVETAVEKPKDDAGRAPSGHPVITARATSSNCATPSCLSVHQPGPWKITSPLSDRCIAVASCGMATRSYCLSPDQTHRHSAACNARVTRSTV